MILGIADPFRVLEPGEVFVQFLVPLFNEQNSPITSLEGKKVIVARHPSLVPSDMQAFDAVWRREFRDFRKSLQLLQLSHARDACQSRLAEDRGLGIHSVGYVDSADMLSV